MRDLLVGVRLALVVDALCVLQWSAVSVPHNDLLKRPYTTHMHAKARTQTPTKQQKKASSINKRCQLEVISLHIHPFFFC